ncbi:MAG: TM2 domain-containing protein [Prolixibacteraceae bacterium]|jgi:TM2 domain-containing membrane protein YozV|nr:TM2 domain-containing protein [Prolixibacteraceae bacterium]
MKNTIYILFVFIALMGIKPAMASSYTINEPVVDQLFDNAVESDMLSFSSLEMSNAMSASGMALNAEKDAIVAILLDAFLGTLGIHRFYLGTETLSGLAYILTCGGIFGVVPLIDFIVLIINYEDISPFVNNPSFFMWKGHL